MGWKFNLISRVAKVLAIFLALTSMNTIVFADENILSLPENGSEAIALKLPAGNFEPKGKDLSKMLQVFVGAKDLCCEGRTAVAGRYVIENHSLSFTPAFGFAEAQDYVARIQLTDIEGVLVPFRISSQIPTPTAQVTGIFPSGDIIPENTLRFYIHFSAPMQPHVAFDHIKLLNADGIADEAAFMRFKQELWNEDRTRLTVLMDPGRIKRNVATNLELGPALQEGNDYRWVITDGWMPVQGETALKKFSKAFSIGPALRELPNSDKWRISSPRSDTRDALTIKFDRPFDAGLLQKSIKIKTTSDHLVDGIVTTSENETVWSFKPNDNWSSKSLSIIVDSHLEDVAGNNFNDLLDHRTNTNQIKRNEMVIPIELLE